MSISSNTVQQPTTKKSPLADFVAVRQATFVSRYQPVWQEFDSLCESMGVELPFSTLDNQAQTASNYAGNYAGNYALTTPQPKKTRQELQHNKAIGSYPLVKLYRQICQHYALARQRHYSPQLVAQLHQRVMIGHQLIYQGNTGYFSRFLTFLFYVFPARLRQHKKLFWLAFSLFVVPLVLMGLACYWNGEMIYSVMSSGQVSMMEEMYNPANGHFGRSSDRASDTDVMMFGHYIRNNVGIDFQIYASGLFAGIGTIISTVYNGVVIGGVAGHLTRLGYGSTFWSFVCGHSAFELTAAVIASTAGLRLAMPLIAPYPYRRKDAFIVAGKQSVQILLGAAFMTFLAAFIEAFWSSSVLIPNAVKYAVSAILWTLVIYYLTMAGRGYPLDDERGEIAILKAVKGSKGIKGATQEKPTVSEDVTL